MFLEGVAVGSDCIGEGPRRIIGAGDDTGICVGVVVFIGCASVIVAFFTSSWVDTQIIYAAIVHGCDHVGQQTCGIDDPQAALAAHIPSMIDAAGEGTSADIGSA